MVSSIGCCALDTWLWMRTTLFHIQPESTQPRRRFYGGGEWKTIRRITVRGPFVQLTANPSQGNFIRAVNLDRESLRQSHRDETMIAGKQVHGGEMNDDSRRGKFH